TKVEVSDIVRVEIHHSDPERALVFAREGGDKKNPFRMEEPGGYRIESSQVSTLVDQVLNAQKAESADLGSNLAQWGLDNPCGRVVLTTDEGRELTLFLGNTRGERLYVTSS